ncbi:MAG: glycosyltransferase [Planctomycetota bacterium]
MARSKRVLMIAYHFPPVSGSSGVHRTLQFARYLRDHDWQPTVLTVHPRAYRETDDSQLEQVPDDVRVVRAFALDTSRHLSLFGRYPLKLALPDNWKTWAWGGTRAGLKIIARERPNVIWSTYPIATAHSIGLALHRKSGIPWVADFRDSMTEDHYPTPRERWESYREIEGETVHTCTRAVFTTPGARRMYAERYPDITDDRWAVIQNGYDEEDFRSAEALPAPKREPGAPLRLVHAGILYPKERDPSAFFDAVKLVSDSADTPRFQVVLRATGHDEHHSRLIAERGLDEVVRLEPPRPYREALCEMLHADGLLLFQAANCNHQIPAKVYEYIRAARPVLALTDRAGDTASMLLQNGVESIAALDSVDEIESCLRAFLKECETPREAGVDESVAQHSREGRTRELAALFAGVVG